jgi:outer membrane lipase/esterase
MSASSKATRPRRFQRPFLAAAALVALLAACGGSTSQFEPFIAERVFAFGDDNSTLTAEGRRYGVNGRRTVEGSDPVTTVFDCNFEPLWVQSVASFYGFVFEECNTVDPKPVARAFMRAAVGANVEAVAAQVEAQAAAGGFRDKDLSLIMAGSIDIFDLYRQYPARSEASLIAEAQGRGERLAQVVNRMVDLGSKVILANLPDLGLSPYARAQAASAGSNYPVELISRLTTAFNERLGIRILLDGRFIGLAQMDLRIQTAVRFPSSVGFVNLTEAACDPSKAVAPNCDTSTLKTDAISDGFLWADETRLAGGGQRQLADLALARAQNNPF